MSENIKNPNLPKHIAIIMDGNGRWAKKRLLPRFIGHQKGLNAVKRIVSYSSEIGIEALTLFAFSTENWKRPKDEVNKLMGLFLKALQKEVSKLSENNVQLRIIGDRGAFSEEIQKHIAMLSLRAMLILVKIIIFLHLYQSRRLKIKNMPVNRLRLK